ncbi:hypothetical protein K458DRAFT_425251 [Lentithecium fluviatile CBS 122367]|uniref:Uncharacterized protein n=1 Tax=Lentithecium fluviatile CBS 122367 TaxID=1168545 RepID=A0A6G1ID01_9PLEO|nr:hypothetical protein K458DRAFT_425251 [Lentithecium fluviatile CBS 122367]
MQRHLEFWDNSKLDKKCSRIPFSFGYLVGTAIHHLNIRSKEFGGFGQCVVSFFALWVARVCGSLSLWRFLCSVLITMKDKYEYTPMTCPGLYLPHLQDVDCQACAVVDIPF